MSARDDGHACAVWHMTRDYEIHIDCCGGSPSWCFADVRGVLGGHAPREDDVGRSEFESQIRTDSHKTPCTSASSLKLRPPPDESVISVRTPPPIKMRSARPSTSGGRIGKYPTREPVYIHGLLPQSRQQDNRNIAYPTRAIIYGATYIADELCNIT